METAKIARLMFAELTRGGPHAWGYLRWDGDNVWFYKEPGRADTRHALSTVTNHVRSSDSRWFVGHMRWATMGSPEENANNHPLRHGNIIGVHNGQLVNHEDVLKVTGRSDGAVVDSEAIFAAVNRWGHAKGLKRIVGEMVAVYADVRKPHLLHVARSYDKHLHIGWTKRKNLIFSSTRKSLEMLEQYGIEFTSLSSVREMRHLVLRNGRIIYRHTYGQLPEPPDLDAEWVDDYLHRKCRTGIKVNEDLYYYNGLYLDADSYIEALVYDDWHGID